MFQFNFRARLTIFFALATRAARRDVRRAYRSGSKTPIEGERGLILLGSRPKASSDGEESEPEDSGEYGRAGEYGGGTIGLVGAEG